MASLGRKLMVQVAFKAAGDALHRLLTKNPQHLSKISPAKIQARDLHHGDHGTNGSVVEWKFTKFTVDEREQIAKAIIQDRDEEGMQIAYKMIEGDLPELCTNVLFTFHVETKGGVDYITWTMDCELLDADNPHPVYLPSVVIGRIKDIEAHVFG